MTAGSSAGYLPNKGLQQGPYTKLLSRQVFEVHPLCPPLFSSMRFVFQRSGQSPFRSLNAIVAPTKICPFAVNTTTQLKNMTKSDNNSIQRGMFQLKKCAGIVTCSCYIWQLNHSIISNGNFWVMPLLHSVSSFILYRITRKRVELKYHTQSPSEYCGHRSCKLATAV